MPSLFSRSRGASPLKKQNSFPTTLELDEFGRIPSRRPKRPQTPAPRDLDVPPPVPDGAFLPLSLHSRPAAPHHDYGYLSYKRHVVLGLEQVSRLVVVVANELGARGGITTPFIFSTTALDVSSSAIKKLIQAFLATCAAQTSQAAADAESRWRDEARFAGPHELGMCLRWGFARAIRSVGGHDVRGLLAWDRYVEFRNSEIAQGYPPAHFATLLDELDPLLQTLLVTLLSLLSRLTANSTSSGHTPPTLSPLFGPLLFGLGPATLAFHHTYTHYLRAVHAMEHLQLVFIRWQDASSTAALGVPVRLKDWIKGYPAMLPAPAPPANQKQQPRRGVRTVRLMTVRRNVRMYAPDLVKSAASWADSSAPSKNGLLVSKEWARIAPPTLKLPPRYSDAYRKRMDMPPNFHPDTGTGALAASAPPMNASASSSSYGSSLTASDNNDYFALGANTRTGDDRFRSLTDLKWGEFESMGFSTLEDDKKLQFDLTESARTERSAKRESMSWNDFSSTGFTRSDAPLSATLQFSAPVAKTISAWPAHNAEIAKKLKKTEKALPPFGWDTEPVVVGEEVVEEAFVDVFCDLIYGGGWMDRERAEEVDRECNWALVEFKSMPVNRTTASGGADPRTATSLVLFEEFVPLEYRQQLALPASSTRRRLPSLFGSGNKTKGWKQAPTLNGRPYVVGHVPHSPTYREVEFEEILRAEAGTKVISLGARASVKVPPPVRVSMPPEVPVVKMPSGKAISAPLYAPPLEAQTQAQARLQAPSPAPAPPPVPATPPRSDEAHSDATSTSCKPPSVTSTKRASRFRLPGGIPIALPVPSPGGRKTGAGAGAGAEYSSVEFEARFARDSGDGEGVGVEGDGKGKGKGKGREDEDVWVDIVVGTPRRGSGEGEKRGADSGADPDVVGREVEAVLAGVRDRTVSVESRAFGGGGGVRERVDRDPGGLDHFYAPAVGAAAGDEAVPRWSGESEYTTRTNTNEGEGEGEGESEDEEEGEVVVSQSPLARRVLEKGKSEQRRVGYFDLHPERRPGGVGAWKAQEREGGEARLAYDVEGEEGSAKRAQVSTPVLTPVSTPVRRLPVPPAPVTPQQPPVIKVELAKVEPLKAFKPVSVSVNVSTNANANGNGNANANANANWNANAASPVSGAPMSKTAALIEMYRERERATSPNPNSSPVQSAPATAASLQASPTARLPVRAHANSKDGGAAPAPAPAPVVAPVPVAAPVPLVAPTPKLASASALSMSPSSHSSSASASLSAPASSTASHSAPASHLLSPGSPLVEPPRIAVEETGRASPARYVHGAPLHNVMEEEEEE
ncbi:hypothetical protein C0992_007943 [Termitomyces sp. T32_za158]|nr:hypothetical protein C0992_007943 [Termitomyces sp. T32_za158]